MIEPLLRVEGRGRAWYTLRIASAYLPFIVANVILQVSRDDPIVQRFFASLPASWSSFVGWGFYFGLCAMTWALDAMIRRHAVRRAGIVIVDADGFWFQRWGMRGTKDLSWSELRSFDDSSSEFVQLHRHGETRVYHAFAVPTPDEEARTKLLALLAERSTPRAG